MQKSFFRLGLLLLLGLAFTSCSGISFIQGPAANLYTANFLQKIEQAKTLYKEGDYGAALSTLAAQEDSQLSVDEQAFKYNLLGVISFSQKEYAEAIKYLTQAQARNTRDQTLRAQINLNLASSYYKVGMWDKSYNILVEGDPAALSPDEQQKYYRLRFQTAKELGREAEEVGSLVSILAHHNSFAELKGDPYYGVLLAVMNPLSTSQKVRLLEQYVEPPTFVIGQLGQYYAEQLYYAGEISAAERLLSWVQSHFSQYEQIKAQVEDFIFRINNLAKIDPEKIGIVLPLSGDRKKLGEAVLAGMDKALEALRSKHKDKFQLEIRDSEGRAALGALKVKELIEQHSVAAVIGGLFSEEAAEEYLAAREQGVMFISLAPIYLPREQKGHLLLELPGSVESQLNLIFSDEMLNNFGRKAAIFYPQSTQGKVYLDEFWRQASLHQVEVAAINSYPKRSTDFRGPVKKMLGLDAPRLRQEEFDLFSEAYAHEKTTVRRIQVLRPQIHFNWVFLVASPKEAMQIIPSFAYFDAFGVNFLGGPSWGLASFQKQSSKLGRLYFTSDEGLEENALATGKGFPKAGKIIEERSFDALYLIADLIAQNDIRERADLDSALRDQGKFQGVAGEWNLRDGLWIKKMWPLQLKNGKLTEMYGTDDSSNLLEESKAVPSK